MPNLIEIQKDSYQWFLDEGLKEAFADISPIADFAGHLSLEFVDFTLCRDDIKYTIEECKERDATYAAPLKVKVRLYNKDKDEMNEHEIFMGDLPLMTDTGSFVELLRGRTCVSSAASSVRCPLCILTSTGWLFTFLAYLILRDIDDKLVGLRNCVTLDGYPRTVVRWLESETDFQRCLFMFVSTRTP